MRRKTDLDKNQYPEFMLKRIAKYLLSIDTVLCIISLIVLSSQRNSLKGIHSVLESNNQDDVISYILDNLEEDQILNLLKRRCWIIYNNTFEDINTLVAPSSGNPVVDRLSDFLVLHTDSIGLDLFNHLIQNPVNQEGSVQCTLANMYINYRNYVDENTNVSFGENDLFYQEIQSLLTELNSDNLVLDPNSYPPRSLNFKTQVLNLNGELHLQIVLTLRYENDITLTVINPNLGQNLREALVDQVQANFERLIQSS